MTTEVYPAALALWFNIQAATEYEPDTCDVMESLENNNQKVFLKNLLNSITLPRMTKWNPKDFFFQCILYLIFLVYQGISQSLQKWEELNNTNENSVISKFVCKRTDHSSYQKVFCLNIYSTVMFTLAFSFPLTEMKVLYRLIKYSWA